MTPANVRPETLQRMAEELVGLPLSPEEAEAILPYVRSYVETAAELERLIETFDDPRNMVFADDVRLSP